MGRVRRFSLRALQVVLGVGVGLAAAEGLFCWKQHGAFPHLNVYAPDPKLGVRLRPGAHQRVEFSSNPRTDVRINSAGFRGAELASPAVDDIMVVGDSQVFGLGVEEHETFSAELAKRTKKNVINAGVPTYGPLEFQALLEEQLPKRKPHTVIYVVNMNNDLLEANRPNSERHVVWDGWAVRRETAPGDFAKFPGRELLFRESHLVFAIRRVLHQKSGVVDNEAPLPSEGSWQDLVAAASAANTAKSKAEDAQLEDWEAAMKKAVDDAVAAQKKLQSTGKAAFPDVFEGPGGHEYLKKNGHPGDIVSEKVYYSEAANAPARVVKTALNGAKIRHEVETLLKKRAEEEIDKAESKAILSTLEEREKLEKKIASLRQLPAKLLRTHSPLYPALEKVKALCDANGARLVVMILPMDVQVSAEEWKKYDDTPVDLAATKVLSDDIVQAGAALGVSVIDTTNALAGAEPGAFLHRDLHMSPKGHAAVASLLAVELEKPPPIAAAIASGPALGFGKVCACHQKTGATSCDGLTKTPDLDCLRTYANDCTNLLACVAGSDKHKPKCLPGWSNHGAHHRCYQACGTDQSCSVGTCTKVKGGRLCI